MLGGGGEEEKRMDIVDGSCKKGWLIKARGVYVRQADHLWSVEELIPEGESVSERETALC